MKGAGRSDNREVLVEEGHLYCLQVTLIFIHTPSTIIAIVIINIMTIMIMIMMNSDTTEPELTEMSVDEILNGIPGSDYQVGMMALIMILMRKMVMIMWMFVLVILNRSIYQIIHQRLTCSIAVSGVCSKECADLAFC